MKKKCAVVFSFLLMLNFASLITVSAEEASYTYELYDEAVVKQDFEEMEAMEDYTSNHVKDPATDHIYGIFSFMMGSGGARITDQNPLSGDHSLQIKQGMDARRWTINGAALNGESYAFECLLRIDSVPDKFTIKLTDINSPDHDNETEADPTLTFRKKDDGKIGIYNLKGTELTAIEINKSYKLTLVCEVESDNYYLFLDEKYVENSKSTFNVEFKAPSAIRIDTAGAEFVVTFDDIAVDACSIKNTAAKPTKEPAAEQTNKPTPANVTNTPKPAQVTPEANVPDTDSDSGSADFPVWIAASITVGVIIIAVIVIVVVKKKKK